MGGVGEDDFMTLSLRLPEGFSPPIKPLRERGMGRHYTFTCRVVVQQY